MVVLPLKCVSHQYVVYNSDLSMLANDYVRPANMRISAFKDTLVHVYWGMVYIVPSVIFTC